LLRLSHLQQLHDIRWKLQNLQRRQQTDSKKMSRAIRQARAAAVLKLAGNPALPRNGKRAFATLGRL
jgi:hypothetical protein